jgi:hypothetical protein
MMIFRIQLEFFRSTLESKEEKLQLNFLKWWDEIAMTSIFICSKNKRWPIWQILVNLK